jgi:hypothetical protein
VGLLGGLLPPNKERKGAINKQHKIDWNLIVRASPYPLA